MQKDSRPEKFLGLFPWSRRKPRTEPEPEPQPVEEMPPQVDAPEIVEDPAGGAPKVADPVETQETQKETQETQKETHLTKTKPIHRNGKGSRRVKTKAERKAKRKLQRQRRKANRRKGNP